MIPRICACTIGLFVVCGGFLSGSLAAADLTRSEQDWYEKVRLLMTADEAKAFKKKPSRVMPGFWRGDNRALILGKEVSAEERERVWMKRVEYAADEFGGESWVTKDKETVEPNGWETQRGFIFTLALGPPQARYVEKELPPPDKLELADLQKLATYLQGAVAEEVEEKAPGAAPGGGLGGLGLGGLGGLSLPGAAGGEDGSGKAVVERWVYTIPGSAKVRVLTFAETHGQVRLVKHEIMPPALAAKGEEITYHDADDPWFPRSFVLKDAEEPPALAAPGEMKVAAHVFQSAVPGAVHVRAVAWAPLEALEKAGFGADGLVGAKLWATVRDKEGQPVAQTVYEEIGAGNFHAGDLVVIEAPLDVRPGSYDLTVVVAKEDKGAAGSVTLEVVDLDTGLSASTPVLTSMVREGGGGSVGLLPASEVGSVKVASQAGGAPADGAQPFVYGRYYFVPEVDRTFTADQTLALYFQVYNARKARVSYSFYQDGEFAGEWESDEVTLETGGSLVRTTPLEGFPAAEYEIRIQIKDEETGQETEASVPFRIEG